MRRVLAIGLAIIIVMIASRGVVAQEDSVSDRLLEILKDRQIISNDEYGELKGLAAEMKDDRADLDQRLGDLDRSISDYLAQGGDATAAGVTYTVGQGFTFTTSDNLFSLTIGGLFQFWYAGFDGDRNPVKYVDRNDKRDTNNFGSYNRFHFTGHAFVEELTYYFEYSAGIDFSGVYIYEGYVDYNLCNWTNIRAGQFRVPFGRQNLVHISDLTMVDRAISSPWIDTGIMAHNMYTDVFGFDGLAAEYMIGLFDGDYASDNSWVAPAMRLVVYPLGPIDYVEGDWTASGDPRIGIGASFAYDRGRMSTGHEYMSAWGIDGVVVWNGLYLTGEWHRYKDDETGQGFYDPSEVVRNWFIQAGFMVMPAELELFIRYAKTGTPKGGESFSSSFASGSYDNMIEWSGGAAYYFEGHPLKVIVQIVSLQTEYDGTYSSSGSSGKLDDEDVFGVILTFQLEW